MASSDVTSLVHIMRTAGAKAREPLVGLAKRAPHETAAALQTALLASVVTAVFSVIISAPWANLCDPATGCERPFGSWLVVVAAANLLQVPLRLTLYVLIEKTRIHTSGTSRHADKELLAELLASHLWAFGEGLSTFSTLCYLPGAAWICNTVPGSYSTPCGEAHLRGQLVLAMAVGRMVFNFRCMGELAAKCPAMEDAVASSNEALADQGVPQPIPRARKVRLPRVPCSQERCSKTTGAPCAICLCNLWPGQGLRVLQCGHYYHAGCIDKWFDMRSDCPLCRSTK
mmetsp:Transcript_36584/g.67049  ORF Transcript_36584/g.67049 Transcript_36584/m.67049 type:complete len:286 (+) Transcript_36584:203-1060(+)